VLLWEGGEKGRGRGRKEIVKKRPAGVRCGVKDWIGYGKAKMGVKVGGGTKRGRGECEGIRGGAGGKGS